MNIKTGVIIYETDRNTTQQYETWFGNKYNLFFASSPEDTLALLERYAPAIHVLVTQGYSDAIELDDFITKVVAHSPDLYIVITTSAFPSEKVHQQLETFGAEAILYKPFGKSQFEFIVDQLMNRHPRHKPL